MHLLHAQVTSSRYPNVGRNYTRKTSSISMSIQQPSPTSTFYASVPPPPTRASDQLLARPAAALGRPADSPLMRHQSRTVGRRLAAARPADRGPSGKCYCRGAPQPVETNPTPVT